MTTQDPRLGERIVSAQQLSAVVAAMRGIAAAHALHSRQRLTGIRAYTGIVGDAISQALGLLPADYGAAAQSSAQGRACVVFGSEQGFVGAFNDRICDAVAPLLTAGVHVLAIGSRGARLLRARGCTPDESVPMIAHSGQAPAMADRVGKTLVDWLTTGRICGADLLHAAVDGARITILQYSLLPLDHARFRRNGRRPRPLTYLPAPQLLQQLAGEYLFAQLAAAALESHAAENTARMQAMAAAQDNIARRLERLHVEQQVQRQDAITDEIVELAAGVL